MNPNVLVTLLSGGLVTAIVAAVLAWRRAPVDKAIDLATSQAASKRAEIEVAALAQAVAATSVQTLRDHMEAMEARYDDELRAMRAAHAAEMADLRAEVIGYADALAAVWRWIDDGATPPPPTRPHWLKRPKGHLM